MAVAAVMLLTGCYDYDRDAVESGNPVRVPLAFTFSSTAGDRQTRQTSDVLQTGDNRRTVIINPKHIIPLIGDTPNGSVEGQQDPVEKTYTDAQGDYIERLYHYQYCNLSPGVNGCFVYAQATDVNQSDETFRKVYNGSLIPTFPTSIKTTSDVQNIKFELESIYKASDYTETNGIPEEASTLAGYLNTVAEASGWKTSNNIYLKNLFENFTGHGSDLPGSAASVKNWIMAVATIAQNYYDNSPISIGDAEKTILSNIVTAANGITITVNDNSYPRNKYLPDGAAAVRWTTWTDDQGSHEGFKPTMQTTTLDNINSVSRFAYPASLYYFVSSQILASDTPVDFNSAYSTSTSWSTVLSENFDSNTSGVYTEVKSSTKAVALESPVQYAVAQLMVTVRADAESLTDNSSPTKTIDIESTTFPLTGVIVCGQRPVNYRFEQASNSDTDMKFIYDSQVKTNGGDYYYLTYSNSTPSSGPMTLVLQSWTNENVNIILEFENKSGTAFECLNGTVYPDTRFYLVGEVVATGGTGTKPEGVNRVFTKDYITTVNMKVSSLAKAYNVLPNLLTSNLEIGIETTPQWVAATPTVIRLE